MLLKSQVGQGALEYILILFVTMSILLGGLYQFHTAFESFANNYMGEYLVCLLETGELPNLQAEPGAGECDDDFLAFSLANGRPPIIDSSTGSSGSIGSGGSPSSSSDSSSSRNRGPRRVSQNQGNGGDGPSDPNASSVSSGGPGSITNITDGGGRNLRRRRFARGGGFDSKNNKNKKVPLGSSADYVNDPYSTSAGGLRQTRFQVPSSQNDEDENEENIVGASRGEQSFASTGRTKKVPVGEKRSTATIDDEDPELTLGGFMRYLLIGAMIIAIFLFLGNQLNSISKSMG